MRSHSDKGWSFVGAAADIMKSILMKPPYCSVSRTSFSGWARSLVQRPTGTLAQTAAAPAEAVFIQERRGLRTCNGGAGSGNAGRDHALEDAGVVAAGVAGAGAAVAGTEAAPLLDCVSAPAGAAAVCASVPVAAGPTSAPTRKRSARNRTIRGFIRIDFIISAAALQTTAPYPSRPHYAFVSSFVSSASSSSGSGRESFSGSLVRGCFSSS